VAEETSGWPGIIAAGVSAGVATVASAFGIWAKLSDARREKAATAAADEVRKNLDAHQRDYMDRVEKARDAEERRANYWRGEAEKYSELAHGLRHEVNNWRHKSGIMESPRVPPIEDFPEE